MPRQTSMTFTRREQNDFNPTMRTRELAAVTKWYVAAERERRCKMQRMTGVGVTVGKEEEEPSTDASMLAYSARIDIRY